MEKSKGLRRKYFLFGYGFIFPYLAAGTAYLPHLPKSVVSALLAPLSMVIYLTFGFGSLLFRGSSDVDVLILLPLSFIALSTAGIFWGFVFVVIGWGWDEWKKRRKA